MALHIQQCLRWANEGTVVEVRGVEPRSEEKILKTSPYSAYLFAFAFGNSGRQDWPQAISSSPLSWLHPVSLRANRDYPISVDVLAAPDGQEPAERVT